MGKKRATAARGATAQRQPSSAWVRTQEPLLWMTGAEHQFITPASAYDYDSSKRRDPPHFALQLTLAGAGYFEKHRRRHLLLPDMAFLHEIPGDFRYGYPRQRSDTYEHVFVSMQGAAAFRWCRRIVELHGPVLRFTPEAAETIAGLMLALTRQRAASAPADRYLVSGQLNLLLMTVLSTLGQSRLALRALVAEAVTLIHTHAPDRHLDVAALASRLECSREHLAREFRAAAGVSPSEYLTQHRLRLAARQLRTSSEKIDAIARRSGFSGANYFCRAFRDRLGVTPGQFRKRPWMTGP